MRKVVLAEVGRFEYQEVPIPEVGSDTVRVKLLRCGICGTDVHNYYKETIFGKDKYPFNMGHETFGIVDAVGEGVNKDLKVGDPVVIDPYWTCGECESCLTGHNNNCDHVRTIGLIGPSGNSEYTVAPAASVVKTKGILDPALYTFVEPIATILYAIDKLKLDSMCDVEIVGPGPIAMLFLQLLKRTMVRSVTVSGRSDSKLELAVKLGADRIINTSKEEDDGRYNVIIDCTGNEKVAEGDIERAKFGCQILFFGVCPIDSEIKLKPFDVYKKDVTIYGSFALNHSAFVRALQLLESGRVDVKPLLYGVYPVGKLEECIHMIHEGKTYGKLVIDTTVF